MTSEFLNKAEQLCAERKEKLTKPRVEVLKILIQAKDPLGAYDILSLLGQSISNPKPPTVYRALEFWQKLGLVHRLERLNLYMVCQEDHTHEGTQHFICKKCNTVKEIHSDELLAQLAKLSKEIKFDTELWDVEITGTCMNCS